MPSTRPVLPGMVTGSPRRPAAPAKGRSMTAKFLGAALLAALLIGAPALAQPRPPGLMTLPGTQGANEDSMVVKVNDTEIRQSDVMAMHAQLPEQLRNMPIGTLFQAIVGQLINRRLAALAASADGLDKDPAVQRTLDRLKERVLEQAYVNKHVGESVTEVALRQRYEAAKGNGALGIEEVRASHILVESEAAAKAALAEVRGGADFAKVAQAQSKDSSAVQGGDLGYFDKQIMVPEFAVVAFGMQKGQVSEPVKTQFGWHVIRLDDRRTRQRTFEEAEDDLRSEASRDAQGKVVEGLRKSARIQQP
ncbi:MAG: peptidylprolyl isomerase [Alphaproteobacteria bacterium]|nr:peptidylprolyl isomerase [Alphaproteobacteria bacterium]